MRGLELIRRLMTPFLLVMFTVGTIGHLLDTMRPLMLTITPFILLMLGLPVLVLTIVFVEKEQRRAQRRAQRLTLVLWSLGTYVVTFGLEAIGVHTGLIFGGYLYGPTLGTQLLKVPMVIGFNWVLVVAGAVAVSERISTHPLVCASLAGALTVVFDWVMEPVAMRLDYWNWEGGVIPFQNYLAWFLIAMAAALVFRLLRLRIGTWLMPIYVGIQLLFFLILRIGL